MPVKNFVYVHYQTKIYHKDKSTHDYKCILFVLYFLIGTSTANPFRSRLSYSSLASWMGKHTQVGNILPKTEIKQGLKKRSGETRLLDSKRVCINSTN